MKTVSRWSSCDINRGATMRHTRSISLRKERKIKTLMWWTLKPVLWLRRVDTDVITFHGYTQTIMSDNHNITCAWCQSKGKTMFANLPKEKFLKCFTISDRYEKFCLCFLMLVFHIISVWYQCYYTFYNYTVNFYFVLNSYLLCSDSKLSSVFFPLRVQIFRKLNIIWSTLW